MTQQQFQQMIRKAVRLEIQTAVREIIQEETEDLKRDIKRLIVETKRLQQTKTVFTEQTKQPQTLKEQIFSQPKPKPKNMIDEMVSEMGLERFNGENKPPVQQQMVENIIDEFVPKVNYSEYVAPKKGARPSLPDMDFNSLRVGNSLMEKV